MSLPLNVLPSTPQPPLSEACAHLRDAAAAKKCWRCGCLHQSLAAIEQPMPVESRPSELALAAADARQRLVPVQYDCLGCEVCYPALAINALNRTGYQVELEPCPTDQGEPRAGWPSLPGSYRVLRYSAPVAACTLTDDRLMESLASAADPGLSLVGTLQTENLGIERVILNLVANPNIRFLLLCGPDSRQRIGHLPGQSLLALSRSSVDERMRIIGAQGKRPVLRNITREAVEHFRSTVELIDLIGNSDPAMIVSALQACAARSPGPAESFAAANPIMPIRGHIPERMVSDPAGYFVVYPDRRRGLLSLEHYGNNGALDTIIEGTTAAELYMTAIEKGLISRLDHAAYLGRELARAEAALRIGEAYVQDAAPEARLGQGTAGCSCGPSKGSTSCGAG